jgi:hypothetical protein
VVVKDVVAEYDVERVFVVDLEVVQDVVAE